MTGFVMFARTTGEKTMANLLQQSQFCPNLVSCCSETVRLRTKKKCIVSNARRGEVSASLI